MLDLDKLAESLKETFAKETTESVDKFFKDMEDNKRPYCVIDGTRYKLHYDSHGVLRFPDDNRPMPDLNKMVMDYINGKIPLSDLWEYDVNSGSSYERVWGIYSIRGWNNHIVLQGKEKTKRFKLYK